MAKKVLIIEDEESLSKALTQKLNSEGYEAASAKTAKEGLAKVAEWLPDLILLDIVLPGGVSGFDLLEEVKANTKTKDIPVIVLTNLDSESQVSHKIGASEYLIKSSTDLAEVLQKVAYYLN